MTAIITIEVRDVFCQECGAALEVSNNPAGDVVIEMCPRCRSAVAESNYLRGHEDGYDEGYDRGHEDGWTAAKQKKEAVAMKCPYCKRIYSLCTNQVEEPTLEIDNNEGSVMAACPFCRATFCVTFTLADVAIVLD